MLRMSGTCNDPIYLPRFYGRAMSGRGLSAKETAWDAGTTPIDSEFTHWRG